MAERGWWDEAQEQALLADAAKAVDLAVAAYESLTAQPPESLIDYQFAELPRDYLGQRQRIIDKAMAGQGGRHHE